MQACEIIGDSNCQLQGKFMSTCNPVLLFLVF